MKTVFAVIVAFALMAPSIAAAADLKGTWSGNWMPQGGVPDSITIELRQDAAGKVSGKFLTPSAMEFTKASYIAKTGVVSFEASDQSGKHYKIDGKVEGNEIKGTLQVNDVAGDVRLIKWTYFGR